MRRVTDLPAIKLDTVVYKSRKPLATSASSLQDLSALRQRPASFTFRDKGIYSCTPYERCR